jgi:hypothetical protein
MARLGGLRVGWRRGARCRQHKKCRGYAAQPKTPISAHGAPDSGKFLIALEQRYRVCCASFQRHPSTVERVQVTILFHHT